MHEKVHNAFVHRETHTVMKNINIALILILILKQLPINLTMPIQCLHASRFYRIAEANDCSKYYLCLDGEVYEFQCTNGLVFDVDRQICDFKSEVSNCAIAVALNVTQRACADGMTVPARYFCDGSEDCGDGSDEVECDGQDPFEVGQCDENNCLLPGCFCSKDGKQIPWNLTTTTPQMILLTFENAVNYNNWDILQEILSKNRKNPNECPIKATFFVSHNNTNYQLIQQLWNDGHEIAVHSITHRNPENWWSQNATLEDWFDEMVGQANILNRFANIPTSEIRGMRAPFLKTGGNRQFLMLKEFGFVYDSSIKSSFSNDNPLWPYTLDYKTPKHTCDQQNCPTRSYAGLWEIVLNELKGLGYKLDATSSLNTKTNEIVHLLLQNFERHYYTNRAPFGLHINLSWLEIKENFIALKLFIDEILKKQDVWFVTNFQAIEWMQNGTIGKWKCKPKHEITCDIVNVCKLEGLTEPFYTCSECPKKYPWFRNEFGNVY